ncbi:hypothetical protein LTR66_008847 [Elasticomyces elasticus]|nr:hypothetical protein LTR66_008847 [Elasticomyces elasticus]
MSRIVNSPRILAELLNRIPTTDTTAAPTLYLDIEGTKTSRHGTISIIELLIQGSSHVYLIDILTLGATAFTTPDRIGRTFGTILQSATLTKAFFNVRNDSDALFALHGIKLQGIVDIQLLELAARPGNNKCYLKGLAKCIELHCPMSRLERADWVVTKIAGKRLFHPESGGSYTVFDERPLRSEIVKYCVQDVARLPDLWRVFEAGVSREWRSRVVDATRARVAEAQSQGYVPNGPHKCFGPW